MTAPTPGDRTRAATTALAVLLDTHHPEERTALGPRASESVEDAPEPVTRVRSATAAETPQARYYRLADAIARAHGSSLIEIRERCRRQHVVAARAAVIAALHGLGWSSNRIGRYVGRDHTTVLHHLGRRGVAVDAACRPGSSHQSN